MRALATCTAPWHGLDPRFSPAGTAGDLSAFPGAFARVSAGGDDGKLLLDP